MSAQKTITDVPTSEVKKVVKAFIASGCDPVEQIKQSDGNWTVSATCPDEDE